MKSFTLLVLTGFLLAGCSSPAEMSDEMGKESVSGTWAPESTGVVCHGQGSCIWLFPENLENTFTLYTNATQVNLTASWDDPSGLFPELYVWLYLERGGIWVRHEGPSPMTLPVFDMIPGTYGISFSPPRNEPYVGPFNVHVDWTVSYQPVPEPEDTANART